MSSVVKIVLIVTSVLLVCIIGAAIVFGLYVSGGHTVNFSDIFHGNKVAVNETKTLDLNGVTSVSVQCASGNINVLPGSEPKAIMQGSLWISKQKDSYLKVAAENGQLVIRPDFDISLFNWSDIDITVYLPADSKLNLSVACASADTSVQNLSLSDLSVSCASGKTKVENCKGGALSIESASGETEVTGSQFTTGRAVCQSGDININNTSGAFSVGCTSGRVIIDNVTGALDVNSISGGASISVSGKDISPIRATVTSGDLTLKLDPDAAFNLDANTTSGGIKCDFERTVSGDSGKGYVGDHVQGQCNGGGASVSLSTVSGNIRILKK